jgi:tetratricopeptide (TPR) repeat protein
MRPTRHVTALLVLAAFAAAACSKRSEAPHKAQANDSARAKPATPSVDPVAAKRTEQQPVDANATAAGAGPMSFADGEAAYRAKKYSDAAAIFERHVTGRPGSVLGHFMLGMSAWKGHDLVRAGKAFDAALAVDPGHLKSLVNLSRVRIEQKQCDEAIDLLTRAGAIEPTSAEVHRLLGRAYHVQGKTVAAVEAYRHAIDLDERDVWSMNNLGLLLLEQQRSDEALPLLVQAVELRKDVPAFHNNLGMALEHTGRFGDAAAAYKEALTADPTYDRAKQNLARVEAVKERLDDTSVVDAAVKGSSDDTRISRLEKKPGQ